MYQRVSYGVQTGDAGIQITFFFVTTFDSSALPTADAMFPGRLDDHLWYEPAVQSVQGSATEEGRQDSID
jgi:hypothetical protein